MVQISGETNWKAVRTDIRMFGMTSAIFHYHLMINVVIKCKDP